MRFDCGYLFIDIHSAAMDTKKRESLQLAVELLSTRAETLRTKQWNVFSWASNIMIGTIGGVVAIAGMERFTFPPGSTIAISCALGFVMTYAVIWIQHNFRHKEAIVRVL